MNGKIGQFENSLERNSEDMYSRKNKGSYNRPSGISNYSPPPNYRGVAFSRDYRPEAEFHSSEIAEPNQESNLNLTETLEDAVSTTDIDNTDNDLTITDISVPENAADSLENADENQTPATVSAPEDDKHDSENSFFSSSLLSKKMSIEDLLIIGAVILFVSGELDGDLLLLLGLLLVAGL